MSRRNWADGPIGNTPLTAARLNDLEDDLEAALVQLAKEPDALFSGAIVRDSNKVATSAQVEWPDGVAGVYSGTASAEWPGATDSYTLTRVGTTTLTFTQPMVTRNSSGAVTNRPPIAVS
jgi:hypothetical protein